VRGDGTTLGVVSRGVLAQGALPTAGVVASEYQLSGTELRARRWDAASEPGPGWDTLSTRLARLRLRYHDGMQWRSEFDSAADGLPRAVEVAMWFGAAPTAEPVESEGFGVPEQRETRWGRPDRLRVIAVPDGGGEGVTP
jgi:hypothetical protein